MDTFVCPKIARMGMEVTMYDEIKNKIINAIADYYHINNDEYSYEWTAGCTICGDDHEYRWLTLGNVLEAIDDVLGDIAYNVDD